MKQIGKIDLNIGQAYLSEWTIGMAIRELIANAIDETDDEDIEINKLQDGEWEIVNKGKEIKPDNFVMNEGEKSIKQGKIGKFGIGLKDAIAVLTINGINVTIDTSEYKYLVEYQKKNNLIKSKTLFIKIYDNNGVEKETRVMLNKCKDIFIREAKSYFINYREKYTIIEHTEYGDVLYEEDSNENGTIYFNGIKIAYEGTFLYSYNIKIEDDNLKKGISRERCNLSSEVYRESLKRIIKCIKNEKILFKYYERMLKARSGSLKGELKYTVSQERVIQYILKNKIDAVIFPVERSGKVKALYNQLIVEGKVKIITLLNSYYESLIKKTELIVENILADNYERNYKEVDLDYLTDGEKKYFKMIELFVKDNIRDVSAVNITIIEERIYIFNKVESRLMIPRNALKNIKECCIKIVNTIKDSMINGENVINDIVKKYIDIVYEDKVI